MSENNKPKIDELSAAMRDLSYAQGNVKEWEDRAKSARSALESHERERAKAQAEVDRFQKTVDLILKSMQVG